MRTRRTTAGLAVLALSATLAATGCSGDDDDDDRSVTGLEEQFSVAGALAELPDDLVADADFTIRTGDLRAATELNGLDFPTDGSRDATAEWLMALTADPEAEVFLPLASLFNTQAASADEFAEVAGWSLLDVDSFVEYDLPPNSFMVATGDFGSDALSPDLVEVEGDIVTDKEGDDHTTDPENTTALNQLGVPTRLAQQGNRIAMSPSTPAVEAWLGDGKTLLDDEGFAAIAEALDDEDVVSAVLTPIAGGGEPSASLGSRATPEQLEAMGEQLDDLLPEEPFDSVGIGWGVDDGVGEAHVAYHFDSPSAAEDSADAVEELYREGSSIVTGMPFSDRLVVDDVEVDDDVVTVSVTPADEGNVVFLHQALMQGELLFISR